MRSNNDRSAGKILFLKFIVLTCIYINKYIVLCDMLFSNDDVRIKAKNKYVSFNILIYLTLKTFN